MKKALAVLLAAAVVLSFSQAATALTIDIVFDGFCDGMHANINQAAGLVDGNTTGSCIGEWPILGSFGYINGKPAVTVTHGASSPYPGLIYIIYANRTWANYVNDGFGITPLYSGTWSPGVPAAAGAASDVATVD